MVFVHGDPRQNLSIKLNGTSQQKQLAISDFALLYNALSQNLLLQKMRLLSLTQKTLS